MLQQQGDKVVVVVRPKDIAEQLCREAGWDYIGLCPRPNGHGHFQLAAAVAHRVKEVADIVRRERPDMLLGSDGVLAYVGWWFGLPRFEFFDDDYDVIKLYAQIYFPFYTDLVCPKVTDAGRWIKKKRAYDGYQKLAYLHPSHFTPDRTVMERYVPDNSRFFIVRLSALQAHHDTGMHGLGREQAIRLIDILKYYGRVFISSEYPLDSQFEPYRMNINPLDIHHLLYFADIYVGDSQSMAVEAAVLGTPAIRCNDFVGRISVLNELEQRYKLAFGIRPDEPDKLYTTIDHLLSMPNLKEEFATRRARMLTEKTDTTAFYFDMLNHSPYHNTHNQ